jgi:hypothetical protein
VNANHDRESRWNKDHLFAAVAIYRGHLEAKGLTSTSVESEWRYGERFVRWLYAEYVSRGCQARPDAIPATRCLSVVDLRAELRRYEGYLRQCGLSSGGIPTYVIQAGLFVAWLPSSTIEGCASA